MSGFMALVDNGSQVEIVEKENIGDKEILTSAAGLKYEAHPSKPLMLIELSPDALSKLGVEVGDVFEAGKDLLTEAGEAADAIGDEAKETAGEVIDSAGELLDVIEAQAGEVIEAAEAVADEAQDVIDVLNGAEDEAVEPELPPAA